jgi:hypothetical protein
MSGPENIERITKNIMRTAFNPLIQLLDQDRTFGTRTLTKTSSFQTSEQIPWTGKADDRAN